MMLDNMDVVLYNNMINELTERAELAESVCQMLLDGSVTVFTQHQLKILDAKVKAWYSVKKQQSEGIKTRRFDSSKPNINNVSKQREDGACGL